MNLANTARCVKDTCTDAKRCLEIYETKTLEILSQNYSHRPRRRVPSLATTGPSTPSKLLSPIKYQAFPSKWREAGIGVFRRHCRVNSPRTARCATRYHRVTFSGSGSAIRVRSTADNITRQRCAIVLKSLQFDIFDTLRCLHNSPAEMDVCISPQWT